MIRKSRTSQLCMSPEISCWSLIPCLWTIDTNVFVAGILSNNVDNPMARIVDAMLDGRVMHLLSHALLQEYRNVLLRSKLRKLHS